MPRLDFYDDNRLFIKIRLVGEEVLIGRSPDCDVQLPDSKVSRVHCVLCAQDDGHTIDDRSWNGTRVNDHLISEPTRLEAGDRIYIERFVMIYQPDQAESEDLSSEETVFEG